jgi:hypothetical protein
MSSDELILQNKFHLLPLLIDIKCPCCNNDFKFTINSRKRKFKKFEMAYYELLDNDNKKQYIHYNCLNELFDKYIVERKLIMNDRIINKISLFDRHGDQMTKVNYIKKIEAHLKAQALQKFINSVSNMFSPHLHFSFHDVSYNLNPTHTELFNDKCKEFEYNGYGINNITPDYVEQLLSNDKLLHNLGTIKELVIKKSK